MRESAKVLKFKKGPRPLKVDLHLHSADDPYDRIRHTSKELISKAAEQGFDVLSITNHQCLTFSQDLFSYARDRGILLIPGIELNIRNRHVLMLNPPSGKTISDFSSLSRWRRPETLVIAPHPYYPGIRSLNGYLRKHLHLFDAIEYCYFYTPRINFNHRAVALSQSNGFPLIGNSDAHFLFQLGMTYSIIHAEKNMESIFAAIRQKKVEVVSRPLSPSEMGSLVRRYFRMKLKGPISMPRQWQTSPPPGACPSPSAASGTPRVKGLFLS